MEVLELISNHGGCVKGYTDSKGRYRTALVVLTELYLGREMEGTANGPDHTSYRDMAGAVLNLEEYGFLKIGREGSTVSDKGSIIFRIEVIQ